MSGRKIEQGLWETYRASFPKPTAVCGHVCGQSAVCDLRSVPHTVDKAVS